METLANLDKHGLDFADFEAAFDFDHMLALQSTSYRAGRDPFVLIGSWNGEVVVAAIVSPLGTEAIALISLRRASIKEGL